MRWRIPAASSAPSERAYEMKILGGESSGHIICLDKTTTGDGIIASLQVLDWLISVEQTLTEACQDLEIYPQTMVNVRVEQRIDLNTPRLQDAVKSAEAELGDSGRVLLRASGTEPLIRVMVEGQDADQVEKIANALAGVVEEAAAA